MAATSVSTIAGAAFLEIPFRLEYRTVRPVPVRDIAESLLALDRIVQRTPVLLKHLYPRCGFNEARLQIERIESGSLLEDSLVKLFFKNQRGLDRFISNARKKLGMEKAPNKVVVAVIVMLIAGGAYYAGSMGASKEDQLRIEASHNTIIQIGASNLQLTPQEIKGILGALVKRKDQLGHDSLRVIRPAAGESSSGLAVGEPDALDYKFSEEMAASLPVDLKPDPKNELTYIENVLIHLRAMDAERASQGWAALAPDVAESRLPLRLDVGVQPEALFGHKTVVGDVQVVRTKDRHGKPLIKELILTRFRPLDIGAADAP